MTKTSVYQGSPFHATPDGHREISIYPNSHDLFFHFERQKRVLEKIGKKNLERFERWAFSKPIIYRDDLVAYWKKTQGIQEEIGTPDEVLNKIILIWLSKQA